MGKVKMLFSIGAYSNVEVECTNIEEAKQMYDQAVMLWGKPAADAPVQKSYSGGNNYSKGGSGQQGGQNKKFSFNMPAGQVQADGVPCLACGQMLKRSNKGNFFCSCWYK